MSKTKHALPIVTAIAMATAGLSVHASGNDIRLSGDLAQGEFNTLVNEIGVATAYSSIGPAATLGITGLNLGASVTSYSISRDVWDKSVRDGSSPSRLNMMRLHARKGLPHGFDIGATYSTATSGDLSAIGGELRKSLLDGSALTPAVSVSGHYSTVVGVSDIDLSSYGIDLGISKGFALFTPFAGIGQIWYDGSESSAEVDLRSHNTSQTRTHLGMRMGLLPFMSVTAQADFSEINSYSLRLNLGF